MKNLIALLIAPLMMTIFANAALAGVINAEPDAASGSSPSGMAITECTTCNKNVTDTSGKQIVGNFADRLGGCVGDPTKCSISFETPGAKTTDPNVGQ